MRANSDSLRGGLGWSKSIGSAAMEAWVRGEVVMERVVVRKRHCRHRDDVRKDLMEGFDGILAAIL